MTADALARLLPAARGLLAAVDRELTSLGAPADHPVWTILRRVGLTPADAVEIVAGWDAGDLRTAAGQLRARALTYEQTPVPPANDWHGAAATEYGAQATALAVHLHDTLAGRLVATAEYAEAVAEWFGRARDAVAAALADVLTSAQAVAIRRPAGGALAASVTAAADIASYLLDAVDGVLAEAEALPSAFAGRLARVDLAGVPAAAVPMRSLNVEP